MIIGICGDARAGKNEAAQVLEDMFGFKQYSFASPIREFMINFLGLKGGLAELDVIKEQPHYLLNGKTPRFAMQTLGTEWGRDIIYENIWVNRCIETALKGGGDAVISDVRFDNEAMAIVNSGSGIIIKITRDGTKIKESSHSSESGINESYIKHTIENSGTIFEYRQKVFEVAKQLKGL